MAWPKLVIQVRVNEGMTRDRNPNVPFTPQEVAEAAIDCWNAGASVVHFHARDPETGAPSVEVEHYADILRRIKAQCDIITMPTLGGGTLPTVEERLAHIIDMAANPETKPDCIPVDMRSGNVDQYDSERREFISTERVYMNTTKMLMGLCGRARSIGVKPVAMMWDVASVRLTEAFVDLNLYEQPLFCELPLFAHSFLGFGHPGTIKGLQALLDFFPSGNDWQWFVDVTGGNAVPVATYAIAAGGHVALGLGDYPYAELGLPTNAGLVAHVAGIARSLGRDVATAAEARKILGFT